jgi:putative transcriptional regulator
MIKCHLSTIMGKKKLKISDVAKNADINRGTITRLYKETFTRLDADVLEKLCEYLECEVGDLLEYIDEKSISP